MLERMLGRVGARTLMFLRINGDGYASEIARTLAVSLSAVQGQLRRFEQAGVIASRARGRTRIFALEPRSPLRDQIAALLDRAVELLPDDRRLGLSVRRRPRRAGKP